MPVLEDRPVADERVRRERARILSTLLTGVDGLADRALEAIKGEIPSYAEQDARFDDDVRDQVRRHYCTKLSALMEERSVTLEEMAFVRRAATRRARAGFALEDYINAYRVGQQVFWEATVAFARETRAGHEAALTLATPIMRYVDFASTQAGHAYAEFRQYAVADADRERRDLLELLLSGEMPTRGPLLAAAQGYGIEREAQMLVATAVPVGSMPDSDSPQAASAALARAVLRDAATLVVVRQSEVVAVPVLRAGVDAGALCERLGALQARLRQEGLPLAMGVSTVATGVAELPNAYQEARVALAGVIDDDGGIVALPRLSPFEYLALRVDGTAHRLIDPRLREFLHEDRARGGVLTATVRAFAGADLKLRCAAERLQIHPNTAQYRLHRIEERSGRNPRRIEDLLELLVAIALDERVQRDGHLAAAD